MRADKATGLIRVTSDSSKNYPYICTVDQPINLSFCHDCRNIAVVVFIAIITFVSVSKDNQKLEETVTAVASNESALSNFTATKTIEGPLGTYKVCVDEANEKVAYISKEGTKVFSFEDMISVELLESGVTISKKSTARTLGGALVGGVLAGGAGMVVGGLSGSSRERRKVSSIILKVTLILP